MSTESSSPPRWKYDVFLCFRGEDTRKGFTDHLYTALDEKGITTFRDDTELEKGEAITPALLAAIEESRFALIVLSQNYASSTWCLNELVRILECMGARKTVLPIFYHVDPADVRKQTGSFGEALANHEERFWDDKEKVQKWRYALTEVAGFSGWNSKEWYESKLIRNIAQVIWEKLQLTSFRNVENLVGIHSSLQPRYDVFLSFRGEDTRKAFTDHLYTALDHQGITTFRDDPELNKGEAISPSPSAAIEESRFALIVLSQKYASSTWCLDELVRILECMKARETVLPIFYDVDPFDVQKQTGSFGEAFASHEERFTDDKGKVQRWRYALTEVASFCGWNSKEWKYESKLIKAIVQFIWTKIPKLQFASFSDAESIVGIHSRLQPLNLLLGVGVDDVRFIGIWGMGGIGKTTMARAVYERISREFEFSFHLTDVRNSIEKSGLLNLQKQLLSGIWTKKADISDLHEGATIIRRLLGHKRVLLILDDVTHSSHLKYLAGNEEWFGSGSRVLITTRNEHLLIEHGVERRLKVEEFNDEDSLQLFSQEAFKKCYPEEDFLDLSKSFINYAKGLPLALEVLGSFLHGRDLIEWNSALSKLGRVCNLEIFDILKTSYDGLDGEEKTIFLDISCFFCGEDKDRVTEVLNSCDLSAIIGIKVLMERSLLTVLHGRLRMHNLLQEMGREIVLRKSTNEPGRRSRLWLPEDVKHVLTKNAGTEAIEGIVLDSSEPGVKVDVNAKSFSMMNRLRYLVIKDGTLSNGLECLPNSLLILKWTGYPLKSLPSHFNPERLLELNMCHSCIEHFSLGMEPLYNLKTIKLSDSLNLVNTPNFKGMPYLEVLFLEGCTRLYKVDPGIEVLERLTLLNLKDCKNLVHFASSVGGLKCLEVLNLSGCSKLKKLPDDMGHLGSLKELHVNDSGITELPSSIGMLERLPLLKMEDCKDLLCLPITVGGLKSLKVVNISGCSKLAKLPEELGHMECLVEVDASGTSIRELPCSMGMLEGLLSMSLIDCKHLVCLPSSVGGLKSLKYLNLSGCSKLDKLPDELGHVPCLKLDVSRSGIRKVPSCIGLLENLRELSFGGCKASSPKSWNMMFNPLQFLRKTSFIPAGLLSGLRSVTKLDLSDCNLSEEAIPSDFGCLASLRSLNLSKNQFVTLPESIGQLYRLKYLYLDWCRMLRTLPELPSHVWVNVSNCSSLDTFSNPIGQSNAVLEATCVNCFELVKNERCKSIALSLLTRYLKFQQCGSFVHPEKARFHFVAPGNEIPEWYNYQSVGSLITVQLHPGWFSNKFMGFALCVVFGLLKPLPPLAEWSVSCSLRVNGQFLGPFGILFGGRWGQPVSDHIWFFYVHRDECCKQVRQDSYYELVFSFKSMYQVEKFGDEIVQVKKCGVRMIYEGDVEELWETLSKQSNTKQGLQHYYDDDDATSSSTGNTKQGLQHYYDDDDDASSSTATGASQEDEEKPHPRGFKRLELLLFIFIYIFIFIFIFI